MKETKIMVVEDTPDIAELIRICLENSGYSVVCVDSGSEALHQFEEEQPDLMILDIELPGMDGMKVCRMVREYSNVPIIMVSCRSDSHDIIEGLRLGADDYITKPFDPSVLVTRVMANLRRAPIFRKSMLQESTLETNYTLQFQSLQINTKKLEVKVDGKQVPMTAKEIQLLSLLARHPYQLFSPDVLYERVWGNLSNSDVRTVTVHIYNIRKKLESFDPELAKLIQNIKGIGYKFLPE